MRVPARDGDPSWARYASLATGGAFVAGAVVALVWDVLRVPPPDYDCGDEEPPGHAAAIAAYRSGYLPAHAGVAVLALGALVGLSLLRRTRAGRTGVVTPTTVVAALLLTAIAVALAGVEIVAIVLAWVGVLGALGLALLAGTFGVPFTASVGAVGLAAAAGLAVRNVARSPRAFVAAAALWLLLIAVAAHGMTVALRNDGPIFC